ncbi:MAG: DNA replication and repair protein RecF [Bacteroidota bacterium]
MAVTKHISLHLQRISLTNFKNYEFQHLDFCQKLNAFVGQNGMGKTNMLDAIYYACMCKSHFGINDRDLVRHGTDFFRLDAMLQLNDKKERIVAKVIPRQKKVFERNDVPYKRLMEHIGLFPIVMIVPDDTRLATDGSEERRRFIDNTLSQLNRGYLEQLVVYNRLLRQRNSLLKQMGAEGRSDDPLLQAYDARICEPARSIHQTRKAFVEAFMPIFQACYQKISNDQEKVDCRYHSQLHDARMSDLLLQNAEKDRILQRSTCGIHKDDLVFSIRGYPLKRFASQGQLKTFVLSLKLAQYEWMRREKKDNPILLLDDIFDKLDRQRVRQLIQMLTERQFGQVFITDTHESRLEDILKGSGSDYRKFQVVEGTVTAAPVS